MYNVLGEFCSLLVAVVFFFFIVSSFYLKEKRNLLFLFCDISLILTCLSDIVSCNCIANFPKYSIPFSTAVSTVFFLNLCLMPFIFALYCYSCVSVYKKYSRFFYSIACTVLGAYVFMVVANIWTGWIFKYVEGVGYVRGKYKYATFFFTGILIILSEFSVLKHRRGLSPRMFTVFALYPVISASVMSIQIFNQWWLMTGISGALTMILMYLAIQTDQMEIDYKSGLKTEPNLSRLVRWRFREYMLTEISVENLAVLQEVLGSAELDRQILSLIRIMRVYISGRFFRVSGSKFIVLTSIADGCNMENLLRLVFEHFRGIKDSHGEFQRFEFISAIVEVPHDAETYGDAREILHALMNRAREEKLFSTVRCTESFLRDFQRRKSVISILERELTMESEQYQVYFQPIISIKKNRFVYAEALSRLRNTELGDISPAEFIPIAEQNGLIERLGRVNFEKVCEFISKNRELVKAVSVNFSVHQIVNPDIEEFVLGTIRRYGIQPENIIMEITESILIDDYELVRFHMENLVKAGIVFYLDDFGTGFSNFANVIRLPFYTIKIDRSFVLMMEKDASMTNLVKNLVSTFKGANLKILVEGVENETQDMLVKDIGADFIQGFLYSRPIPMPDYIALLQHQNESENS